MEPLPLWLMVLDGLSGDYERIETLRDRGRVPAGLAAADEGEVLDAVRGLLRQGFIEAWEHAGDPVKLVRTTPPATDDESLRGYWFSWTAEGEQAWREGREDLEAHDSDATAGA